MAATQLPQYKIGVWGPKSAGKTIYLWVFTYLIDTVQALRNREWCISADDETREQLNLLRTRIVNRNSNLPDSTDTRRDYQFLLQGYGQFTLGRLGANILFTDWPGEALKDDTPGSPFYQELKKCDAVLCFIDPLLDVSEVSARSERQIPEDSEQWAYYQGKLNNLFHSLTMPGGGRQQVAQVIAFLVTKVDHKKAWWDSRYRGEELLQSIIKESGMNLIKNHCTSYRIFPCSSVGAKLSRTGIWEDSNLREVSSGDPGVSRYEMSDLSDFEKKPFGVVEPMIWALEELKRRQLWR